ncbi:hypothetical protein [Streptomyces adustus]
MRRTLCVYIPEPGSATTESLRILSSWTTAPRPAGPDEAATP